MIHRAKIATHSTAWRSTLQERLDWLRRSGRKHRLAEEIDEIAQHRSSLPVLDARHAYRQFGKGRRAAALNFGDCLAFALARELGEPLLFKGGDFSRTDVMCHPASL